MYVKRDSDNSIALWGEYDAVNGVVEFLDDSTEEAQALLNPVPESIPALNGMLAIDNAGMASAFQAWLDSPNRTFAEKAYFSKADRWRRSSPIIAAGAGALGLSESQTDDLFRAAAQLNP